MSSPGLWVWWSADSGALPPFRGNPDDSAKYWALSLLWISELCIGASQEEMVP